MAEPTLDVNPLHRQTRITALSGETRPDRLTDAESSHGLGTATKEETKPEGETRKERVLAHAMFTPGRQAGCICVRLDLNSNRWRMIRLIVRLLRPALGSGRSRVCQPY